ncbi:alpha/beta fold hydrolase [Paractinoplanes brasiliensis]|uniref:Pimeloyl-ACP methyl ester carboxylesterase n=1 Tax=Paractinoplanes brasiliensis TaxID=52695 RepID=A0A4R6JAG2_9ACTN|nr:alpha/beta fold hydrolase [Actinoplanes brasiliensis]TDO32639.1 pimeloyl-ACP methyl ester carboxylesterase [Actinoplanes brasiliensis]GID32770.1 hydrolase [Actinoplanes brasiliensis]
MTFVTAGSLRLWTERIGHPGHSAVLLIMGASAQGLTCPGALIDRLVGRGVQVIRYDHRDTGRSSIVDYAGNPYGLSDLAGDALAVLDAYGLESASFAGMSMGGMIAQWLGVHAPSRVRSLTLISSTPMNYDLGRLWQRAMDGLPPDPGSLPPPSARFLQHRSEAPPGVEADVELFRVMNGDVRPYDEAGARTALTRCWARTTNPAAAAQHNLALSRTTPDRLVPLSTITAPTLVLHGDQDPIYAVQHGEALAEAIPGASLRLVPGMGHVCFSPGLPEELADLILL